MPESLIHILLVEDDEVDVMNVKRAFKKNHILNPLHIANDGTVHQPNVGRPGTTPSGMLARNYLVNPKERLTLLVDPDSPNSGASNSSGRFSPQLLFTVPEPSSAFLAGAAILFMTLVRRRA